MWTTLAWALGVTAAILVTAFVLLPALRTAQGRRMIRRAGPRLLWVRRHRLWREPGEAVPDLRFGPGGRDGVPEPPFVFVEEHLSGSQPCVAVRDARDRLWRLKWGYEARPESFAVRVSWGCGYFAEITHFVSDGRIEQCAQLGRASACVDAEGRFRDARFEIEDPRVRMLFNEHSWSWDDNPFVGTRELSGLKLLVMLLSNWDAKDRRDVSRGSNTAIFEHRSGPWKGEAHYLIADWGGAMGKWGTTPVSRGRWDVAGFEAQTPQFVTGVADGMLTFGYQGQRTAEITGGITADHARWFHRHADRLSEQALRDALLVCGATDDEAARFAAALRERIRQVGAAAESG